MNRWPKIVRLRLFRRPIITRRIYNQALTRPQVSGSCDHHSYLCVCAKRLTVSVSKKFSRSLLYSTSFSCPCPPDAAFPVAFQTHKKIMDTDKSLARDHKQKQNRVLRNFSYHVGLPYGSAAGEGDLIIPP